VCPTAARVIASPGDIHRALAELGGWVAAQRACDRH